LIAGHRSGIEMIPSREERTLIVPGTHINSSSEMINNEHVRVTY